MCVAISQRAQVLSNHDAKVGNKSMHIPAFPSLNITFCEQRKKEETSTRR